MSLSDGAKGGHVELFGLRNMSINDAERTHCEFACSASAHGLSAFLAWPSRSGQSSPGPNEARSAMRRMWVTSVFIGRNEAGKSSLIQALLRLFGATRDERNVQPSDLFVPPN